MSPTDDLAAMSNDMETRIATLEQRTPSVAAPAITVTTDPVTGVPVIHDSLTWNSGWESYSKLGSFVTDPDPDNGGMFTGGSFSTAYGAAQAYRMANTCFLTGVVRRLTSTLATGTRHNLRMFMLPEGWRPVHNVPLLCATGSTAPDGTLAVVASAWVEVRPDITQTAGGVYFVAGSTALTASTGWISLQGSFLATTTSPTA